MLEYTNSSVLLTISDKNGRYRALPRDTVIITVIRRTTPHRTMLLIEKDGVDRPRCAFLKGQRIAHFYKRIADILRRRIGEQDTARTRFALAERAAHLETVDIRGLGRTLDIHPELDSVEEELQQVLVLAVAALHREA